MGTITTTTTATTIITIMPDTSALLTLLQWLSPAYPVGAFSYSHGLEWAVEAGDLRSASAFEAWARDILHHGAGRNDAILLAQAHAAPDQAGHLDAEARALAPSAERLLETAQQGAAFARTVNGVHGLDLPELCYPVAVGVAARRLGLPLDAVLPAYLHAFAANLTSAAIRLVPLGQTEGQAALAALAPDCASIAAAAPGQGLDDLGGCAYMADIAAMKHETQYTRLFRS